MSDVHIGSLIEKVWRDSRLKGTEFAQRINMKSHAIYPIFKRKSVNTELLEIISRALEHNFFQYYSNEMLGLANDPRDESYLNQPERDKLNNQIREQAVRIREQEELIRLQTEKISDLEKKIINLSE